MGDVKKFIKKYNVTMPQTEFFIPRTCEYYLHYNVKLRYPEGQTQTIFVEKDTMTHGRYFKQKKDLTQSLDAYFC